MKKVGILTYINASNYGAILQAYALQHIVKKYTNIECKQIYYLSEEIEKQYNFSKIGNKKGVLFWIKSNLNWLLHLKKNKQFNIFRQKHIVISEPVKKADFADKTSQYDIIIVGSDQVWNYECMNCDWHYLLDVTSDDVKKVSYAASFGKDIIDKKYEEIYKKYLSRFQTVSVRELSGVSLVENVCGRESRIDIDPVFLLTREDWNKFVVKKDEKYIFVYQLYYTDSMLKFADDLSKKTGLPVKLNTISLRAAVRHIFDRNKCWNAAPDEFVSLIANAEYVVTNSFHGTALSMILNKPFFVERIEEQYNVNSRFDTLLENFGLQSRVICSETSMNTACEIDYDVINTKINQLRNESLKFLDYIIQEK